MKLLYIVNYASPTVRVKGVNSFWRTAFKASQELGYEFHTNTNSQEIVDTNENENIHYHVVEIYRNPFSKEVLKAKRQLDKLLKSEKFDAIHCNTPIGGVLGRICGKKAGVPRIIYQAHGFHFYKGAPKLNWLVYYPIEKWLAHYTDALITINQEDYELAKNKFHLRNNGQVYYVPGVGIDLHAIQSVRADRTAVRASLGLKNDDIVLISTGRLDANKNNETTIRAVAEVPNVILLLCGEGELREDLEALAESLGIADRVLFLGNRTDIMELYQAADVFVMMSFREGLSRSIMEAMASGLPCIVSKIRGNVDLIEDGIGGYLCDAKDVQSLAASITKLAADSELRRKFAAANLERVRSLDVGFTTTRMREIYQEVLRDE